jgi:hypothetical protein
MSCPDRQTGDDTNKANVINKCPLMANSYPLNKNAFIQILRIALVMATTHGNIW